MITSNPLINSGIRTKSERQKEFLEKFEEYMSVSAAAEAANIGRTTIYDWLKNDLVFRVAYEKTVTVIGIAAENELVQRVFNGVPKQSFYRGKSTPEVRQYSDKLLLELLRARMPHRYGRNANATTDLPIPKFTEEEISKITGTLQKEGPNTHGSGSNLINRDHYGATGPEMPEDQIIS